MILARLLFPEDFGKVALSVSIMEMIARLKNISIESAVIRKQLDEDRLFSTQFFLIILLEIPFLIAVLVSRPYIISHYEKIIADILLILAVAGSIRSISIPYTTLMQKNLEYKKMALFFTVGPLFSIAITLLLAFQGFGVWSLVTGRVLNYIFDTIIPVILVPWRPSWSFDVGVAKDIWQYCSKSVLTEILAWFMWAGDDFIVGTWLGTDVLGLYTMAWNLSSLPTQKISQVVDGVAFPTYAKLQYDRAALSQAFTNFSGSVARICAFISLVLVIIAPEFITIMLGKKWLPAVTTFQIMIVYAILRPVYENAGSVFMATGNLQYMIYSRIFQALILIFGGYYLSMKFGIEGMAWAIGLMMFVGVVIKYYFLKREIDFSIKDIFIPPFVGVIIVLLSFLIFKNIIAADNVVISLIIKSVLVSVLYGGLLFIIEGKKIREKIKQIYGLLKG